MRQWLRFSILFGVLTAAQAGDLAMAQTPPALVATDPITTADIRCLMVGMAILDSAEAKQDPALKNSGTLIAIYFVGRLDGRTPNLDLEGQLLKELKTFSPAALQETGKSCGERLTLRGLSLAALGEEMQIKALERAAAGK